MAIGLDDVVAAETALSDVDGLAGRLIIRGHSLAELAGTVTEEDVLQMLFGDAFDRVPTPELLGAARVSVFEQFKDRDHCELSQARKALRDFVFGQVAKGETDEKRLVVFGLTHLKQLEKQAAK